VALLREMKKEMLPMNVIKIIVNRQFAFRPVLDAIARLFFVVK
jgi:hypothetical protein